MSVDTAAIEAEIQKLQENIETEEPVKEHEEEAEEPEFDVDAALEGTEPVDLENVLTEEQAIEKATKRGWREDGKDRYGNRISAIEFLEKTPFFNKIEVMHHNIEEQNAKIRQLVENSKLIAQKAVEDKKKLVEELKEAKSKLLDNEILDQDNILELKKIDKQIEDNSDIETEEVDDEANELAREYEKKVGSFKKENQWYEKDPALRALADKLALDYVTEFNEENGRPPPPDEMFNHVVGEVKKSYPDLGKKKTRVAATGRRTVVNKPANKKTLNDIPEEMRDVARMVMDSAGLTEDEYLKTYEFD